MSTDKQHREELADLSQKAKNAKEAAAHPKASDRDKADLKILEQKAAAKKLEAKHPNVPSKPQNPTDAKLDKALKDSFPGSDPVSFTEAAPAEDKAKQKGGGSR
jgi:hypothetical protein